MPEAVVMAEGRLELAPPPVPPDPPPAALELLLTELLRELLELLRTLLLEAGHGPCVSPMAW